MHADGLAALWAGLSSAAAGLALVLLVQSTLLIGIGLLAASLLRSKDAAVQSIVYRTTLVMVLVCPVVSLVWLSTGTPGLIPGLPGGQDMPRGTVFGTAVSLQPAEGTFPSADASRPISAEHQAAPMARWNTWEVLSVVFTSTWIAVAGLLLARLAVAQVWIIRLVRSACPADPSAIAQCCKAAGKLGVAMPEVLSSPFISSPCLVGVRRPAILLPEGESGPVSREVLLHELAHLLRRDTLWSLLVCLSTSIWFFQPLLWRLRRRLTQVAEEVCDDYVVHFGADRCTYARRLTEIAERYDAPALASLSVITLKSMLGQRIERILDDSRQLSLAVRPHATFGIVSMGLLLALLLGPLGVAADRLQPATETTSPPNSGANAPPQAIEQLEQFYALRDGEVLRRIAPPFPAARMDYYRQDNPIQARAIPAGPDAMFFRWQDNHLRSRSWLFGVNIQSHLQGFAGVYRQEIEGDRELLRRKIPGDFVVRADQPAEKVVAALEGVLREELDLPVRLQFREVERDVYVARGRFRFTPLPGYPREIQLYGRELTGEGGGGEGNLDTFLKWVGMWIEQPVVNELREGTDDHLAWGLHYPRSHSPTTDLKPAQDPALVLPNLTKQTGLEFTKERRKIRILFVEKTN